MSFVPFIVEPDPKDPRMPRVRIGQAHTGPLCLGELLEQVISLSKAQGPRAPYGMRTDEEWAAMQKAAFADDKDPTEIDL